MGQITIDYPDAYHADLIAGLRAYLGEDGAGLTDSAAVRNAVRRFVKAEVRKTAMRNATSREVAEADTAMAARETAADAALQARRDAEAACRCAVDAAFGADS